MRLGDKKKVCLIGNSHLGVLKEVVQEVQVEYPNVELTFFGVAGAGLYKTVCSEGKISSNDEAVVKSFIRTSGGMSEVLLEQYDAFVIHGLSFPLKTVSKMLGGYSANGNNKDCIFISSACLEACFASEIKRGPFKKIVDCAARFSESPVFVSMAPMWSVLEQRAVPNHYREIFDHSDLIYSAFESGRQQSFDNVIFLDQPAPTLENRFFSKEKYSMGFDSGTVKDYGHMNNHYGHLVLQGILSKVLD